MTVWLARVLAVLALTAVTCSGVFAAPTTAGASTPTTDATQWTLALPPESDLEQTLADVSPAQQISSA